MVKLNCHKAFIEVIVEALCEGGDLAFFDHFKKFYGFFVIKARMTIRSFSKVDDESV